MTGIRLVIFLLVLASWLPGQCHQREKCRIAIDVGHTEREPGAISSRGVGEFHFNREVARLLLETLNGRGSVRALIINEKGSNLSLPQRAEAARLKGVDLLISIHHDSVQPRYLSTWTFEGEEYLFSDDFRGLSVFYSEQNAQPEASAELAMKIGSHLRAAGFRPTLHHAEEIEGENRELVDEKLGVYRYDELVILKTAEMRAVLLECGVIVNREEEVALSTPEYRQKLAEAVGNAIEEECNER